MPLRTVPPLDDDQWLMVIRCLYSNEPEFIELRKWQSRLTKEACEFASKIKIHY